MNVRLRNEALARGEVVAPGLFPHLDRLARGGIQFRIDFGLEHLPQAGGVLVVRGPRQYGKSTWLEQQLRATVLEHGPATAFYLNGDHLADASELVQELELLAPAYRAEAKVRRLFIDEITAVEGWEKALKRVIDLGMLDDVLVVTTGSRATDLRRGSERLPGRKGRLDRTHWYFTPIPFAHFEAVAGDRFGAHTVIAYLLSGGCPIAATELIQHGRLPEHVIEMVRDWIFGECSASGRDRSSLIAVWDVLIARGGTPLGQANLARESGLANNTVAAGYLQLLADLMCVGSSFAWDENRDKAIRRKPAKFPPINLLAAVAFDRERLRSVDDFLRLPPEVQGRWYEWLVAQEVWRRAARRGDPVPDELLHWASGAHEIDFVVRKDLLLEVKRGQASATEFGWVRSTFPNSELWVASASTFRASRMRGVTLAELLRDPSW
jgi:predicted AAA+ superfamily ATPase